MTALSLPIPAFDRWGNLDPGKVVAGGTMEGIQMTTLADIHARFVAPFDPSGSRPGIWDGWMRHRAELDALGLQHSALVNGSFTTKKDGPKDIDLCYLLDGKAVSSLDATGRREYERLFDHDPVHASYKCDVYPVLCYPVGHLRFFPMIQNLAYWTRVWGEDRNGHRKCVLMVGCGARA